MWASDGVNSTRDASDTTFTVTSKLPRIISIEPVSGTIYVVSQTVAFEGSVFDLDDGFLSDANLQWSSSLMGPLGAGETLQATDLITGTHVITLTATDSDGNTATATTTVIVKQESPTIIMEIYLPLIRNCSACRCEEAFFAGPEQSEGSNPRVRGQEIASQKTLLRNFQP